MLVSEPQLEAPRAVFLHYFDIHFLEMKKAELFGDIIANEARLATRIALLAADELLLPAASYFESAICRRIIDEFTALFDYGMIWLIGGATNIDEFVYRKLQQYDSLSSQYRAYSSVQMQRVPPFRTRRRSSTGDIETRWTHLLRTDGGVGGIAAGTRYRLPTDFEHRWELVPEQLDGRAFIVPYVMPLLLGRDKHPTIANRLHAVINEAYFASYVEEFEACTVGDLIYLASPHVIPSCGVPVPFRWTVHEARKCRVLADIQKADVLSLLEIRQNPLWQECLARGILRMQSQVVLPVNRRANKKESHMDELTCFITHGHDDGLKLGLKDYLQNTLGLPEPVILHQQPNRGRTVIEKFEECAQGIDVAFVLLTPDDIGGLSTNELRDRARQNVIYELGYFVGRFGRRSGRVILLHKGALELPSDLAGVVYIDVTSGIEEAGELIRRELQGLTRASHS